MPNMKCTIYKLPNSSFRLMETAFHHLSGQNSGVMLYISLKSHLILEVSANLIVYLFSIRSQISLICLLSTTHELLIWYKSFFSHLLFIMLFFGWLVWILFFPLFLTCLCNLLFQFSWKRCVLEVFEKLLMFFNFLFGMIIYNTVNSVHTQFHFTPSTRVLPR